MKFWVIIPLRLFFDRADLQVSLVVQNLATNEAQEEKYQKLEFTKATLFVARDYITQEIILKTFFFNISFYIPSR